MLAVLVLHLARGATIVTVAREDGAELIIGLQTADVIIPRTGDRELAGTRAARAVAWWPSPEWPEPELEPLSIVTRPELVTQSLPPPKLLLPAITHVPELVKVSLRADSWTLPKM